MSSATSLARPTRLRKGGEREREEGGDFLATPDTNIKKNYGFPSRPLAAQRLRGRSVVLPTRATAAKVHHDRSSPARLRFWWLRAEGVEVFPPLLGIAKEGGRADMADATNATTLRTRPPPWYFWILRLVGRRISTPMLVFDLGERWIIRGQEWERKKTLGDQRWW